MEIIPAFEAGRESKRYGERKCNYRNNAGELSQVWRPGVGQQPISHQGRPLKPSDCMHVHNTHRVVEFNHMDSCVPESIYIGIRGEAQRR